MMRTAFSDPGILPRKLIENNQLENSFIPQKFKVLHLGHLKVLKVCETCGIVRPFRSNHCHDCDNCVERFDHHCPWLGNCVAKRNYKFFYFFITFTNFLSIYLTSFSSIHIARYTNNYLNNSNKENISVSVPFKDLVVPFLIIIFELLTMIFVTGLFCYHTALVFSNMTTKEELKDSFKNVLGNPYTKKTIKSKIRDSICPVVPVESLRCIIHMRYSNNTNLDYKIVQPYKNEENKDVEMNDVIDSKDIEIKFHDKVQESMSEGASFAKSEFIPSKTNVFNLRNEYNLEKINENYVKTDYMQVDVSEYSTPKFKKRKKNKKKKNKIHL